jgi:DNA-binding transcriptional LysR family regulator
MLLTITPRLPAAYCAGRLAAMRAAHTVRGHVNLDLLRSFFAIVEHGSLNKAAERLRVSQSTLTRQVHALEHTVGGRLFERETTGVALTATGHALADGMRPVLGKFDAVLDDTRKLARGQSAKLRVGYLMSAASCYLHPALAKLRASHPEVKVKLHDLSPGEQIEALRKGELDVAMVGNVGTFLAREFFVRRVASLPVLVALPENHTLAARGSIRLADLKRELFVGAPDRDMPGHNAWVGQLCRRAGFRPRFLEDSDSLAHGLATIVTDGAVALLPQYAKWATVPGVVFRPLQDAKAKWDLIVAWQRGKPSAPVRAILDALPSENAKRLA